MVDATTSARPAMTDHEHFVAELPRFSAPMDFRNSSAVVNERINQLAATVVERRETAGRRRKLPLQRRRPCRLSRAP